MSESRRIKFLKQMVGKTVKQIIICKQCGSEFTCGSDADRAQCWCRNLPSIMPLTEDARGSEDCYCQKCLEEINFPKNNFKTMRYVIAGGGAYGTHYLKKIQTALEKGKIDLDEVIVVDKNPECRAKEKIGNLPKASIWVGSWNEFSHEVWSNRQSLIEDVWIPAPLAPHILSDWIIIKLEKELGLKCVRSSKTPKLPDIPFAHVTPDGRILLSHAPGQCPLDCIEPEVCAITEDTRWWEMRDTLVEMLSSEHSPVHPMGVAMFFCKHHCDAGQHDVGGISFKTIYEETDKILQYLKSGNHAFGIATFSSCHGIMNLFEVSLSAATN